MCPKRRGDQSFGASVLAPRMDKLAKRSVVLMLTEGFTATPLYVLDKYGGVKVPGTLARVRYIAKSTVASLIVALS
jgi:hypothetical protein